MRLQLSMLLLPMATRVNFCAMKFISLVVLDQLNMPNPLGHRARAFSNPVAAAVRASSQDAGRNLPPSRTKGWVKRWRPSSIREHNIWKGSHELGTARHRFARRPDSTVSVLDSLHPSC